MARRWYQFHGRILLDATLENNDDDYVNFKNWNSKANNDRVNGTAWEFEDEFDVQTLQGNLCSLNFILSSAASGREDDSTSRKMQLRICLPWGGKGSKMDSDYGYCLIKLKFLDRYKKVAHTRYVHVEPNSGECDRDITHHAKLPKEVATFHCEEFCSIEEMQKICILATYGNGKSYERIVADVEVIFGYELDEKVGVSCKRPRLVTESLLDLKTSSLINGLYSCGPHPSYTDVVFKLLSEDGEVVRVLPAHKAILAAASPVFHSMFTLNMLEKKTGEIILKDVPHEALAKFLSLIQKSPSNFGNFDSANVKGEIKQENGSAPTIDLGNIRMALEVLKLADRYQVLYLKEYCTGWIVGNPNSEFTLNLALDVYLWGSLYGTEDLCFRSCQWIRGHKSELKTDRGRRLLDGFMQNKMHSGSKCSSFLVSLLC